MCKSLTSFIQITCFVDFLRNNNHHPHFLLRISPTGWLPRRGFICGLGVALLGEGYVTFSLYLSSVICTVRPVFSYDFVAFACSLIFSPFSVILLSAPCHCFEFSVHPNPSPTFLLVLPGCKKSGWRSYVQIPSWHHAFIFFLGFFVICLLMFHKQTVVFISFLFIY